MNDYDKAYSPDTDLISNWYVCVVLTIGLRRLFPKIILIVLLICCVPFVGNGQLTETICQTHTDALIGPDRNDWAHNPINQTPPVNEAYLHNIGPPLVPCGLTAPTVTSLVVNVEILTITTSMDCSNVPVFGNILFGCPLSTTSVCPIEDDVLSVGCSFGGGATSAGNYSLDITGCGPAPSYTDAIGVDLVPSTHTVMATCPVNGMAISTGEVAITYQICIEWTYENSCDDMDPCTVGDVYDTSCNCVGTLSDADGDGVCCVLYTSPSPR